MRNFRNASWLLAAAISIFCLSNCGFKAPPEPYLDEEERFHVVPQDEKSQKVSKEKGMGVFSPIFSKETKKPEDRCTNPESPEGCKQPSTEKPPPQN